MLLLFGVLLGGLAVLCACCLDCSDFCGRAGINTGKLTEEDKEPYGIGGF